MKPKVLVISNECFSKSSSNGRTLGNFFLGWPQDKLAQFYLSAGEPDFDYCKNYFRVTDSQALEALKKGKCYGGCVQNIKSKASITNRINNKRKRNALTMLARNAVWRSRRWENCGFLQWVDSFKPEIILLQAGDFAFMYRLATKLSKKYNAHLVIYNSEGYIFKKNDYFRSKGLSKRLYPIFYKDLKSALKMAYKQSDYVFYICNELKRAYDEIFFNQSETIYTSTNIVAKKNIRNKEFTISYCGNLGLNRHKILMEIAEVLQNISPNLYVNVYGNTINQMIKDDLEQCEGIHYHGLVSYEEVGNVLYNSDLILHVESFDKFYQEDLKFAFSTKIADSLACGTCFLVYAPASIACCKYLVENEAAYVTSDKTELKKIIELILFDEKARNKYIPKALKLVEENHNNKINVQRFQHVLENL